MANKKGLFFISGHRMKQTVYRTLCLFLPMFSVRADKDIELIVNCRKQELQQVPTNLPTDLAKFDLSHNHLRTLPANAFCVVKDISTLILS